MEKFFLFFIFILIIFIIFFTVDGCRKETKYRNNIADLEREKNEIRTIAEELRRENNNLENTITEYRKLIEQIEQNHSDAMENILGSQDTAQQVEDINNEFGKENSEFGEDIEKIEEILMQFLE